MGNERSKYAQSENRLSIESVKSIPKPKTTLEYQKPPICQEGEFGPVFKAFEQENGHLYAVKKISLEEDEKKLALFVNKDIKRLRSLKNHPNVVQIVDWKFDEKKNQLMVINEYLAGGDLERYIETNGKFSPWRAVELLYQIVKGALYLKKTGIIFRELRTKNVLITTFGQNDYDLRLKIGDFGFNKSWYSQTRKFGAKPPNLCLAPEIADSKGLGVQKEMMLPKKEQNSVVWSVGVVFYHMVYGKKPFKDRKEMMKEEVQFGELESGGNEQVKNFVLELLRNSLERDREKRMNLNTFYEKIHDMIETKLIDQFCTEAKPVKKKKRRMKGELVSDFPFLTYAQKMNERRKCKFLLTIFLVIVNKFYLITNKEILFDRFNEIKRLVYDEESYKILKEEIYYKSNNPL
jgi:serine/threonine protein kinase